MNIKKETGSIAIVVIVSMLFIVGILTSIYMSANNRYKVRFRNRS